MARSLHDKHYYNIVAHLRKGYIIEPSDIKYDSDAPYIGMRLLDFLNLFGIDFGEYCYFARYRRTLTIDGTKKPKDYDIVIRDNFSYILISITR